MIAALRSEFRKVLTVRSTYVLVLICLVLEGLASGYGGGFNAPAAQLHQATHFQSEMSSVISLLASFIPLIGILLVTHEYRYNTIAYTLTASRRRSTVLAAKIVVISVVALSLTVLFGLLSPLFVIAGAAIKGHSIVHQVMPSADLIFRLLFTGWAFSMFGLIISFIARIQVAAMAAYFIIPTTIEQLLGLLLKAKQDYLPYISVDGALTNHHLSHGKSMVVAMAWVVSGLVAAWILFQRRDAS